MDKVKIVDEFEFAKDTELWKKVKNKWQENIIALEKLSNYLHSLLDRNDFRFFGMGKETYDNIITHEITHMVGTGFEIKNINDKQGFFKWQKCKIDFVFAHFDNIEIELTYKYKHNPHVGWLPYKHDYKIVREKLVNVLYRIGFEMGYLKMGITHFQLATDIINDNMLHWANPHSLRELGYFNSSTISEKINNTKYVLFYSDYKRVLDGEYTIDINKLKKELYQNDKFTEFKHTKKIFKFIIFAHEKKNDKNFRKVFKDLDIYDFESIQQYYEKFDPSYRIYFNKHKGVLF